MKTLRSHFIRHIKRFGDHILYWSFIILTVHVRFVLGFIVAPQCPWACSDALQLFHDNAVGWRIGEYCPYKYVCPPQRVPDHSAAAQVLDLESQATVSVIRLEQCVVGVWAKELKMNTHIYHEHTAWILSQITIRFLGTWVQSGSSWLKPFPQKKWLSAMLTAHQEATD